MKKFTRLLLATLLASLISISGAFALQSFTISDSSFTRSVDESESVTETFTISSTGNESINLALTKNDLVNGSNTIGLTLNQTTISNLENGTSTQVSITYNSGSNEGVFLGNVTITNSDNSSQTQTITLQTTVIDSSGAELEITSPDLGKAGQGTIRLSGELDEKESIDLRFENTGDIDLVITDIRATDLDGDSSSDEIEKEDIDFEDTSFTLEVDDRESIELEVDIPKNIDPDDYEGEIIVETNHGNFKWDIIVEVESSDEDEIFVKENTGDVRSNVMKIVAEAGDNVKNYDFYVDNDGSNDVSGITFELDSDLEEENTANTIPRSAVTFSPTTLNVDSDENEDVEINIDVPEDAASGTYFADVNVLDSSGDELDSFRLELKVVGDIYIKEIKFDENVKPGQSVDVEVTVVNQGSKLYRNVVVRGSLFDVDSGNSDIYESSSSFLLDVDEEQTKIIRFRLPEDATDGGHTLEIKVQTTDEEIIEVEQLKVTRPNVDIEIQSNAINPGVAKCDT